MRENLFQKAAENGVLVAAHRGSCGGNLCQNTALTFKAALLQGADILELDVIRSTDGVFYVFHDNQEGHVLHLDRSILELSSAEIDELMMYNWLDMPSGLHLSRLTDILDEFSDSFINIDRSWRWWPEMIALLNQRDHSRILLKSHAGKELLACLEKNGPDIPYMPIVSSVQELQDTLSYDINTVAAELLFRSTDDELVSPDTFAYCREKGLLTFVNAETISILDKHYQCGPFGDNVAIAEGFDKGWGGLVRMGFDIIQTDWAGMLKKYTQTMKK